MRARQRSHRRSIRDHNIDSQVLILHRAMAEKLLKEPQLAQIVTAKIEERYAYGKMHHGAYLTWTAVIESLGQPEIFLKALLDDSPRMRKLRRNSPFVGLLTEQERQTALDAFACGETKVETLF